MFCPSSRTVISIQSPSALTLSPPPSLFASFLSLCHTPSPYLSLALSQPSIYLFPTSCRPLPIPLSSPLFFFPTPLLSRFLFSISSPPLPLYPLTFWPLAFPSVSFPSPPTLSPPPPHLSLYLSPPIPFTLSPSVISLFYPPFLPFPTNPISISLSYHFSFTLSPLAPPHLFYFPPHSFFLSLSLSIPIYLSVSISLHLPLLLSPLSFHPFSVFITTLLFSVSSFPPLLSYLHGFFPLLFPPPTLPFHLKPFLPLLIFALSCKTQFVPFFLLPVFSTPLPLSFPPLYFSLYFHSPSSFAFPFFIFPSPSFSFRPSFLPIPTPSPSFSPTHYPPNYFYLSLTSLFYLPLPHFLLFQLFINLCPPFLDFYCLVTAPFPSIATNLHGKSN